MIEPMTNDAEAKILDIGRSISRELGLVQGSHSVSATAVSMFYRNDQVGLHIGWEDREQSLNIAIIKGASTSAWHLEQVDVVPLSSLKDHFPVSSLQKEILAELNRRLTLAEGAAWLAANRDGVPAVLRIGLSSSSENVAKRDETLS